MIKVITLYEASDKSRHNRLDLAVSHERDQLVEYLGPIFDKAVMSAGERLRLMDLLVPEIKHGQNPETHMAEFAKKVIAYRDAVHLYNNPSELEDWP